MQGSGEVRRWCKDLENLKGRKAALRVLMNLPCVTLCFGAFFWGGGALSLLHPRTNSHANLGALSPVSRPIPLGLH